MAKQHNIKLVIREDGNGEHLGWWVIDESQKIEKDFESKQDALTYIHDSYADKITVDVHNAEGEVKYKLIIEDQKIKKYIANESESSEDYKTMELSLGDIYEHDKEKTKRTVIETPKWWLYGIIGVSMTGLVLTVVGMLI